MMSSTRRQGVHTEFSIKDLNTLAPCSIRSSKTCKTASTADLSNSANLNNSKNNNSKNQNSCESFNSSFSDLAKERSGDFSFDSAGYTADFTASNSTLDWDDNEAFPKVKGGTATPSTTCSRSVADIDLTDFVVLSAFQVDDSCTDHQQVEEEESEEEDKCSEYSEDEAPDESDEEEFPLVDFDQTVVPIEDEDADDDDESQVVLAPPPRDSVRIIEKRRSSIEEDLRQSREDQETQAALCQFLARSGIDKSPAARRSRGRSFKQHSQPPIVRTDSNRSSITENDVHPARLRRNLSGSRPPPTTRGRRISTNRDRSISRDRSTSTARDRSRSISRDRSTATAPNPSLDIVLDRPLLGRANCDDSEAEEDLFAVPAVRKQASERRLSDRKHRRVSSRVHLRDSDDCSRDSSKASVPGPAKTITKRSSRRRSVEAKPPPTRRSVRATKSGNLPTTKRVPINDLSYSTRSNPEHPTVSLEDRLNNLALIDASSRSHPETIFAIRGGDPERKARLPESKQVKARRKCSKMKASAVVPALNTMLG
jgi:hypothetical protein